MILKPSDFKGQYQITSNKYTDVELLSYIQNVELSILKSLLGYELADLFLTDLINGEPQTQIFINIFKEFQIQEGCRIYNSKGIKDMLLSFTYCDYVKEQLNRNTVSGNVQNNNSLATPVYPKTKLIQIYNNGVDTHQNIQWYVLQNKSIYPEFLGTYKNFTYGI